MKTAGDVVIDVDGLRMRYGTTDVLTGVTFRAHQGEVLVMLGPNGAGKSTTLEILEGFRMDRSTSSAPTQQTAMRPGERG